MKYTCKECRIEVTDKDLCYFDSVVKELIEHQLCFNCDFWYSKLNIKDNPKSVRVEGVQYYIGDEDKSPNCPSSCMGYSGRLFIIIFKDNRRIETRSLWCNGTIPERFKNRLPDNAIFIKED